MVSVTESRMKSYKSSKLTQGTLNFSRNWNMERMTYMSWKYPVEVMMQPRAEEVCRCLERKESLQQDEWQRSWLAWTWIGLRARLPHRPRSQTVGTRPGIRSLLSKLELFSLIFSTEACSGVSLHMENLGGLKKGIMLWYVKSEIAARLNDFCLQGSFRLLK